MPKAAASTAEIQGTAFTRGTKVRLVDDIPGYPAGSSGKVAVANGFTWIRYWVRFTDGESIGHIDHGSLVKAKDYDRFLVQRDREATEAAAAAEDAATADAGSEDSGGGAAVATGSVEVNGVAIPQRLLDMSVAARIRLGA